MKILNLFAGIGGNRTLWGDEHEITAVEFDPDIMFVYAQRFPNDRIVVGDALDYMMKHMHEFDLICAGPPCPSHSKTQSRPSVPWKINDFTSLYAWVNLEDQNYEGLYVWENVVSTYHKRFRFPEPNVKIGRHYFWSNFSIPKKTFTKLYEVDTYIGSDGKEHNGGLSDATIPKLMEIHKITVPFNHPRKRTILRNCVDYRVGKYILDCVLGKTKKLDDFFGGNFFI